MQQPEDLTSASFASRHDAMEMEEKSRFVSAIGNPKTAPPLAAGLQRRASLNPARPPKPPHFQVSEQYPKRRFPLSPEEGAKLATPHDSNTVFTVIRPLTTAKDTEEDNKPSLKLVFKLKPGP